MTELETVEEMTKARPVEVANLRKEFGDLVAVDGIDIRVEAGELLVLLGPSGCGKSTTLRMIAGLEVPTAGTVHIGDTDVTNMAPQNRDISMVFQSYALYPHLTVEGNLKFPLRKMDLPKEDWDDRVYNVAKLLEIEDLLDKKPDGLSGGQQQRVALGRTIVSEPSVFLLDEPLSNLDQKLRVYARAEIRSLQQRLGTTTIHVTHDQEEAMSLADKIAIMRDGRVEQFGRPEEVYKNPVNEFVAGFLGEPEMNFVSADDGDALAEALLGDIEDEAVQTVGFRPHEMYQASAVDGELRDVTDPVTFTVDVIEPFGDVYEIDLRRNGSIVTGEFDNLVTNLDQGQQLDVIINREYLHFFDADGATIEGVI